MKTITLTEDFYNKVVTELKSKYFENIQHGKTDNEDYYKYRYVVECFSNGCLTYNKLISKLSKFCNAPDYTINEIVVKYVEDFDGYVWKPKINKYVKRGSEFGYAVFNSKGEQITRALFSNKDKRFVNFLNGYHKTAKAHAMHSKNGYATISEMMDELGIKHNKENYFNLTVKKAVSMY